jgi:beta-RFAP synthase
MKQTDNLLGETGGAASEAGVSVTCTARLHLGFFDLTGGPARRFGSIGLALDQPITRLVVRRAPTTWISGPEHERIARALTTMRAQPGLAGHHAIEITAAMPAHAGLGSGTQVALALATALRRLHGCPEDLPGDAERLGRGARSGIGIGLFQHGGLVVDGGKAIDGAAAPAAAPPLLARMAVPRGWRVLLVMDRAREGLSGHLERTAFETLAPMTEATAGTICRLVLMQALPALAEQDLPAFGAAISAIQCHVGDHFAPRQGGRFTSPAVASAMSVLAAAGATGIGQSSWGPSGFAFAGSVAEAQRLHSVLRDSGVAKGLDVLVCRPRNRGAAVARL